MASCLRGGLTSGNHCGSLYQAPVIIFNAHLALSSTLLRPWHSELPDVETVSISSTIFLQTFSGWGTSSLGTASESEKRFSKWQA